MSTIKERQLVNAIAGLPRTPLAVTPTPLEGLPRLSKALAGPSIYIKRDDLTGLAFGGNKSRMLELSLAVALEEEADTIVFGAAVQSNYCRQLSAACAKLGMEVHLLLRPEREIDRVEIQGNHLLDRLFGAHVTVLDSRDRVAQKEAIAAEAARLRGQGKRVYVPRQPDTVDLDVISYAESALEVVQQCRDMEIQAAKLYVAAFDTTQAGLVLGFKHLDSAIRVQGISPLGDEPDRCQRMAQMANQAAARLDLDVTFGEDDFDNDDSYVGERYGIPTEAGLEAIGLLARLEGILLDPVYSSKAFSALIADIRAGRLDSNRPVIFHHTGGTPALFGYTDELLQSGQVFD